MRTGHRARHPRVGLLEAAEAVHTAGHNSAGRPHGGERLLQGAWASTIDSTMANDFDHKAIVHALRNNGDLSSRFTVRIG